MCTVKPPIPNTTTSSVLVNEEPMFSGQWLRLKKVIYSFGGKTQVCISLPLRVIFTVSSHGKLWKELQQVAQKWMVRVLPFRWFLLGISSCGSSSSFKVAITLTIVINVLQEERASACTDIEFTVPSSHRWSSS